MKSPVWSHHGRGGGPHHKDIGVHVGGPLVLGLPNPKP